MFDISLDFYFDYIDEASVKKAKYFIQEMCFFKTIYNHLQVKCVLVMALRRAIQLLVVATRVTYVTTQATCAKRLTVRRWHAKCL